jgi:hypothetical protein
VTFAFILLSTFVRGSTFMSLTAHPMVSAFCVGLMENLRILPLVTLTRNSSKKKTSGEQVKSFHLRRV